MSVLQPYIDKGTLKVVSGQTEFTQVAIQQWKLETAQARMETILNGFYAKGDTKLDGVLSPVRRPVARHPERHQVGRHPEPDRHRSGRREAVGQADPGRRAVLDDLQGHPQAR